MAYENPFDMRRYGQIFGNQQAPNPLLKAYRGVSFGATNTGSEAAKTPDQSISNDQDPVIAALSKIGNGRATDAYRNHIAKLPNQADYEPSKWRRLGAALTAGAASFGRQPGNAMELGAQVRDAPYRGALENWQTKGAGLQEQAKLEAADQTAQIARMKQILDYKDKQADNERLDRTQKSTQAYQEARIKDLQKKGWKDFNDEQGNLILYDPATGERQNMGPTAKTTDIRNDATRLGYEGQRVGFEGDRTKQGASNTAANWARVGQAERGLGLEARRTAATEKNAVTSEKNAATNAANRGASYIDPRANDAAETMAARNVVTQYPQFQGWVNKDGMVRLPSEYGTGFLGMGAENIPDPNKNENYKKFLELVEAEKQKIISTRRPGASSQMFSFDELDK